MARKLSALLALLLPALFLKLMFASALAVEKPDPGSQGVGITAPTQSWTVFSPVTTSVPMSANLVVNGGFEQLPLDQNGWSSFESGYGVEEGGGRGGGNALRLDNPVASASHGAYQWIELAQTQARPLYFSAWSKALNVSGEVNSDYSLFVDIAYTDGTYLWGQTLNFDPGSHDWQFQDGFILSAKPIQWLNVYCLLRYTHSGTAWFDDVVIREVQAAIISFDGAEVIVTSPAEPPYGGSSLSLATQDGLSLELTSSGGAIANLEKDGVSINDPAYTFASGFFVRDAAEQGDFVHTGGLLTQTGQVIQQSSQIEPLDLSFSAVYTAAQDRIQMRAMLTDTRGVDRAVTLYFALPVEADGWMWGDDIRSSRLITGSQEFANFYWQTDLGANGYFSRYPWGSLSSAAGGLALGIPLDQPRLFRLVYNPAVHQFYLAWDVGLSSQTTQFPRKAWVDLVLYRTSPGSADVKDGFRAASQGYYERFPQAFERRIPTEQEGIWVAFSDLSPITDTLDFGIGVHETGDLNHAAFDDALGVRTFRYISEPWSHWLPVNEAGVDPGDYNQVLAYLQDRYQNGQPGEQSQAEAILSSGFFDDQGRYFYHLENAPWCQGIAGCAVFHLNPDPDILDAAYPLNKANLDWNDSARSAYTTTPGLDGEYIDSFLAWSEVMDFRQAHFAASNYPLTFRRSDRRLGIPQIFATSEFARWLAEDVHHNLGKETMANAVLEGTPWGADLFDYMGIEVDWLDGGSFQPDSDATFNYRRTLAYQRPYGLLMNTNFDDLTYPLVERYFQTCLFYGVYPSMFSHNASENPYWENPALYNRDRPLFRRYVPLIRRINQAGWQPLIYAHTSNEAVFIERFGSWPQAYFSLRNTLDEAVTVTVTLDTDNLGINAPAVATALLAGQTLAVQEKDNRRTFSLTLEGQSSEVIHLTAGTGWQVYLPLASR